MSSRSNRSNMSKSKEFKIKDQIQMLDRQSYMRKFGNPSAMTVNTNIKIKNGDKKKKLRSRQTDELFS